MSDVKWIKIVTDVFDNRKIKQIEKLPEADAIINIWFRLLCLAGTINQNGQLLFTLEVPYTDEMLVNEFNKAIETIRLALNVLVRFNMIEIIDNIYCISNWEKYQNTEGLDKLREQTRLRVAKHRAKQKQLTSGNVTVTLRNDIELDKELDKELDIELDKELDNRVEIINYLNEKTDSNFKSTTQKTKDLIKARFNEKFNLEDFKKVIDNKVNEWVGTEWEKFLRPETLFGNKFESYLNQKQKKTTRDVMRELYEEEVVCKENK